MKHLLLFLDGLAGDRSPDLDDRTPLEAAERSTLDAMAVAGRPAAIEADPWGRAMADAALLGLAVGIDPAVDPLGPAVLAAAAAAATAEGAPGVLRGANADADADADADRDADADADAEADADVGVAARTDVRLAVDLVTIEAGILLRADAGGVTDEEGRAIAAALGPAARTIHPDARITAIGGHRLALDLPAAAAPDPLGMVPPDSLLGCIVADASPAGEGSASLRAFVADAARALEELELVEVRREAGLPVPTHAWPWGLGRVSRRLDLGDRYEGRRFAVVGRGEAERGFAAIAGAAVGRAPAAEPAAFVEAVMAAFEPADVPGPAGTPAGTPAGAGRPVRPGADVVIAWWRPPVRTDDAAGRAAAATAADALVVGPLRRRMAGQGAAAGAAGDAGDAGDGWRMAVFTGPARATADGRLLDVPLVGVLEGTGFHGPLELPFTEASAHEAELRFRPGDDLLDYLIFGAGIRRPRRPRRPVPSRPSDEAGVREASRPGDAAVARDDDAGRRPTGERETVHD